VASENFDDIQQFNSTKNMSNNQRILNQTRSSPTN